MKTITFIIAILLFLLSACNKLGSTTITGRLMQSCDTPAANREGSIITSDGLLTGAGEILFFTSDENGYFEATYSGRKSITSFRVSVQGNGDVLRVTHLEGKKKELGDVYINPFPTNFVIKLDVKNPYTENDTLEMFDFKNPYALPTDVITFSGPFESGVIDSVANYNFGKFPLLFSETMQQSLSIRHRIRSFPDVLHTDSYTYFNISPICSNEFAEVTLIID